MKLLNESKSEDSLSQKVKGGIEKKSIPGADFQRDAEFKNKINLGTDEKKLDNEFFKEFFPWVEGHAAKIDKLHSERKSSCYNAVKNENIRFHDEEVEGPNWIVKNHFCF